MLVFTSNDKSTTVTATPKNLNTGIRLAMFVEGPIKTNRQGQVVYVSDNTGVIGTVIKQV